MKFQLIAAAVAIVVAAYFFFSSQFPLSPLVLPFQAVMIWISINIIAWVFRKYYTRRL